MIQDEPINVEWKVYTNREDAKPWRINPSVEVHRALTEAIYKRPGSGGRIHLMPNPFGDLSKCEVVTDVQDAKRRIHAAIFDEKLIR